MPYRWDPTHPTAGWRTATPADGDLRASDAERNEVADRLSRHFAEGRLDQPEFKERLDRAMGATTRGDLRGLFDDLPRLHSETPPPPPRRRRLVPFALIIAFVALAAGSSLSLVHGTDVDGPHVTWLLLVGAALFFWARSGRRHHRHAHHQRSALED